jgi:hypothetical protein
VSALSPSGQRLRLPRYRAGASRDGVVRVSRETDGGGGKAVMLVLGMGLDAAMLAVMARGCAAPAARAVPSRTVMSRCRASMSSV